MSKLDKLFISGIRSYGIQRDDAQMIQFYSPLTLFLGQNGCGKTTIIEALKYTLSGELPGGTKNGQGFIADPYMHQVVSVCGQIKLNVKDVRGNAATVIRIAKCEQTVARGLKFSKQDATISYMQGNGERETISHRQADLNALCAQLMGVPHAILNNVIFCHQEQSLWPLDEAQTLKQKFDEIFDSVRYNKSVDIFRNQIKVKKNQLKVLDEQLNSKRLMRDEADEKRRRLESKRDKLQKVKADIIEQQDKLQPIKQRIKELLVLQTELNQLQNRVVIKRSEMNNNNEMQTNLKGNLRNVLTISDSELKQQIGEFNNGKQADQRRLAALNAQRDDYDVKQQQIDAKLQHKNTQLVQTKAEIKALKAKREECDRLINQIVELLNVTTLENLNDLSQVERTLKQALQSEHDQLQELIAANKSAEGKLQEAVNTKSGEIIKHNQIVEMKQHQIADLKDEIEQLEAQIDKLNVSDTSLNIYRSEIAKTNDEIAALDAQCDEAATNRQLRVIHEKLRTNNERIEELNLEIQLHQTIALTGRTLDAFEADVAAKRTEIERIKRKSDGDFQRVYGGAIPSANLKRKLDEIRAENEQRLREMNRSVNELEKEAAVKSSDRQTLRSTQKELTRELDEAEAKLERLCDGSAYPAKCEELRVAVDAWQREKGELSAAKILYERFIRELRTKKCCPVCSSNFEQRTGEIDSVVVTMRERILDIPRKLKQVEESLQVSDNRYKEILQIKPYHDKQDDLRARIATNTTQIDKLENDLSDINRKIETLKVNVRKPQEIVDLANNLSGNCALIDQLTSDITNLDVKVRITRSQIPKIDSGRTHDEAKSLFSELKASNEKLLCNKDDLQDGFNKKQKCLNELKEKRNKFVSEELEMAKLMHQKPQLLEKLETALESKSKYQNDIATEMELIKELNQQLDDEKMLFESTRLENAGVLDGKRERYHSAAKLHDGIRKLRDEIVAEQARDLDGHFNTLLADLTQLQNAKEAIKEEINEVIERVGKLREDLSNREGKFRELQDNQLLRDKQREADVLQQELDELMEEVNADKYRTLVNEKQRLEKQHVDVENAMSEQNGERRQLEQTIIELDRELENPNFKNATVEYRNKYLECKMIDQAIRNIKLYAEALENAICMFHKTRMMEINRSIRQLWRQIYRGNDIDYIEIVSGEMKQVGNRRVYNYRVMQSKNNTMLEMRGRCSAGQKVLACLIIRIALADAFSANCGILTLDEPTTNLDRQNIQSLGESLARFVSTRQAQKNFQLIVITHDEDFLNTLRDVDVLKKYYRVARNANGSTVIKSENL